MPSDHRCSSGLVSGVGVEVAGLVPAARSWRRTRRRRRCACRAVRMVGVEQRTTRPRRHAASTSDQGREDAPDATRVEGGEAESARVRGRQDDRRDQVARDDEEDVDADEAARDQVAETRGSRSPPGSRRHAARRRRVGTRARSSAGGERGDDGLLDQIVNGAEVIAPLAADVGSRRRDHDQVQIANHENELSAVPPRIKRVAATELADPPAVAVFAIAAPARPAARDDRSSIHDFGSTSRPSTRPSFS